MSIRKYLSVIDDMYNNLLFIVASVMLCLSFASCKRDAALAPASMPVVNRSYVELRVVQETEDASHTLKVTDSSGKTWYAETVAGVDLGDCDYINASVYERPSGDYGIELSVKDNASKIKMTDWSENNQGRAIGIFIRGRLIRTVIMKNILYNHFVISAFKSKDEAEEQMRIIQRGGHP